MITLEGAYQQALSLQNTGTQAPHIKLAVWASQLSANNSLEMNGKQTRLIAPFTLSYGVTSEEIAQALKGTYLTKRHVEYMTKAQRLYEVGALDQFSIKPNSPNEWLAWREELAKIVPGLAYKTASMAALLMWPTQCELAIIDRHVLSRLHVKNRKGKQPNCLLKKAYLECEQVIALEANEYQSPYALGVWHWFMWEGHRQEHAHIAKARKTGGYESHNNLSVRWY